MPYPGQFHRLVLIGNLFTDTWNTTLSIVPSALGELGMPAVDTPTLEAVADDIETWFSAVGGFEPITQCTLTGFKLNRIGTDGRYVDPVTMEYTWTTPIPGVAAPQQPAQIAQAVTLRTAIPRGRGSKGRMFLPPNSKTAAVGTDGRVTAALALAQANATKILINALNSTYDLIGRVGVASDAGAGRFEHVTEISVGRVVDTIRSRRSKLEEDYQTVAV